jgi:hypothetical protein
MVAIHPSRLFTEPVLVVYVRTRYYSEVLKQNKLSLGRKTEIYKSMTGPLAPASDHR